MRQIAEYPKLLDGFLVFALIPMDDPEGPMDPAIRGNQVQLVSLTKLVKCPVILAGTVVAICHHVMRDQRYRIELQASFRLGHSFSRFAQPCEVKGIAGMHRTRIRVEFKRPAKLVSSGRP